MAARIFDWTHIKGSFLSQVGFMQCLRKGLQLRPRIVAIQQETGRTPEAVR
jgi:hypothetical protein